MLFCHLQGCRIETNFRKMLKNSRENLEVQGGWYIGFTHKRRIQSPVIGIAALTIPVEATNIVNPEIDAFGQINLPRRLFNCQNSSLELLAHLLNRGGAFRRIIRHDAQ